MSISMDHHRATEGLAETYGGRMITACAYSVTAATRLTLQRLPAHRLQRDSDRFFWQYGELHQLDAEVRRMRLADLLNFGRLRRY